MVFRISEKLNTKIKAGRLRAMPLDENPYADWSCNLFTADRTQYILLSNTKSLYSCAMFGSGITNGSGFIASAFSRIREFMEDDGQQFAYHRFIVTASETVSFAKSLNRSVTGSMNDLVRHARAWLEEGDLAPHDVGFRLNEILMSSLARSKTEFYRKPIEAFKDLATTTHIPKSSG